MEVGKQYNLTCRVFGVAPIRDLTMTLLKGEEQLLVKTFKDHTDPQAGTVVVNHHIIAQKDDHSKTITCQTSLDLGPKGPLLENTSHNISLQILGEIPSIAPRIGSPGAPILLCYEDNCSSQRSSQPGLGFYRFCPVL
ncbi:Intercellular adhesion molecule 5, partial [Ophiophagus hannah]